MEVMFMDVNHLQWTQVPVMIKNPGKISLDHYQTSQFPLKKFLMYHRAFSSKGTSKIMPQYFQSAAKEF